MKKKAVYILLFISFLSFGQKNTSKNQQKNHFQIVVNNLSFIKNNEYFNLIADGYTLFGNKLTTNFEIQQAQNYKVSIGFVALKYYGLDYFSEIIPTFGLEIYNGNHIFNFGKLYTEKSHYLLKQFYTSERLLDKRSIENGIEHRYHNKNWQTDTWLEWEHFIFKQDAERERLNFGQSTQLSLPIQNIIVVNIPFQFYVQHRGGQINIRNSETESLNNAMLISNVSVGFDLQKKITDDNNFGIRYNYLLHRINSDNVEELVFKKGNAHLIEFYFTNSKWKSNIGYWKAFQFIGLKGDDMFQSRSMRVEKYYDNNNNPATVFTNYTEPNRSLLFGNISYRNKLYDNLFLQFYFDVFYQLKQSQIRHPQYNAVVTPHFDYAMGLYLIWKINMFEREF